MKRNLRQHSKLSKPTSVLLVDQKFTWRALSGEQKNPRWADSPSPASQPKKKALRWGGRKSPPDSPPPLATFEHQFDVMEFLQEVLELDDKVITGKG